MLFAMREAGVIALPDCGSEIAAAALSGNFSLAMRGLFVAGGSHELKPGCSIEYPVMGDQWHAEAHRGGCDPSVSVMELAGERMADLCAVRTQGGARGDHLIIRLDDGQFSDAAFESSAPQLTPPGAQNSVAEFHHGLEREQDGPWADQHAVVLSESIGAVIKQPADDHRVHDNTRWLSVGHASASAA